MFKTPEKRLAEIALYELVVEELEQGEAGYMPPKGGFAHLSDDDIKLAVDYMVEQSQ